jgi:metallo-beta-lactamase family protein
MERKWAMFKGRLATVREKPWEEQTDMEEALAKMDYAMTRLLSRL